MNSICQRIGSYLPAFNFKNAERAIVLGVCGVGYYMKGWPLAIAELGLYLWGRKYVLPASPEDSTRLSRPEGKPANILWKGNSCFCSSPFWSFFTNEPAVLDELPEAIRRRLNEARLFPMGASVDEMNPEQKAALSALGHILRKERFTLADFKAARESLQQLEIYGFPPEANNQELKALLSLLELHDLIREFQTRKSISGEQINALREMAYRVDPSFRGRGTVSGDAHELFQSLADLIFGGSKFEQNLTTSRTGIEKTERSRNWGAILLPMPPPDQAQNLQSTMEEYLQPKNEVQINYGRPMNTYRVREKTQFDAAPPLLILTLKRGEPSQTGTVVMNMNPIEIQERLELGGRFCRNGQRGLYQLVGVSRHMGTFAHYDAVSRRPNGTWYYCDDLKNDSVYPFNSEELPAYAKTGYIFFFRRIS